jgi:hypothetical protein
MDQKITDLTAACIAQLSREAGEEIAPWMQAYIASTICEDCLAEARA